MRDSDENDEKIIAIPEGDPSLAQYKDIHQLPQHLITEMGHFFEVYKSLEGKKTYVLDIDGPNSAQRIISKAISFYKEKFEEK